jgi:hypothetical protein
MRFEHKLFPLGCQEMIAKGSHIRDGGAAEEALKPQLSGFQVSSRRGHGELGNALFPSRTSSVTVAPDIF